MFVVIFLLVVGVIMLIASRFIVINLENRRGEMVRNQIPNVVVRWAGIGAIVMALIFTAFSSYIVVKPGEVAVPVLFGTVEKHELGNGLHFVNPFYSFETMNVQLQEYTMSAVLTEGKKHGDDAITVLSSDGMEIKLETTTWWALIPANASEVYTNIGHGFEEKIVRPSVRSILRDVSVGLSATDIYSIKRAEFVDNVTKSLDAILMSKGLKLEKFLLRDVTLPATVKAAIDEKIASEQRAQQMVYTLQKEKQEAERKRIEAQGVADFQKIVNTGLTKDYLTWKGLETAKELIHSNNAKLVFFGQTGQPFVLNP